MIGKWLSRRPRVLILDEPTRGVDIGARAEIHRLIRNLAAEGVAVIVISSEAEELPEVCDRVLVMAEGRVVKELAGAEMTRANIVAGQLQRNSRPNLRHSAHDRTVSIAAFAVRNAPRTNPPSPSWRATARSSACC